MIKINNDLSVFIKPNYANTLRFSAELLSQIKPAMFNFGVLPDLFYECNLSVVDKEKLIKIREVKL